MLRALLSAPSLAFHRPCYTLAVKGGKPCGTGCWGVPRIPTAGRPQYLGSTPSRARVAGGRGWCASSETRRSCWTLDRGIFSSGSRPGSPVSQITLECGGRSCVECGGSSAQQYRHSRHCGHITEKLNEFKGVATTAPLFQNLLKRSTPPVQGPLTSRRGAGCVAHSRRACLA